MARLHLTRLEDRAVPATVTWDGFPDAGGEPVDNRWTTPTNWVGDVAPQPGDDLVFADGGRAFSVNDFPDGTAFGRLTFTESYFTVGNRVALAGGVVIANTGGALGVGPQFQVPVTLTASQSFTLTNRGGYGLSGGIDLNGFDLAIESSQVHVLSIEAPITGVGNVELRNGRMDLEAANTFTGTTAIRSSTVVLDGGSLAGPVRVDGGQLSGGGTIGGPLTVTRGYLAPYAISEFPIGNANALAVGGLDLSEPPFTDAITSSLLYGSGISPRIVVTGSVRLGGRFDAVRVDRFPVPGTVYRIIDNDGNDPVLGSFRDLPEGAIMQITPVPMRISYRGGDGNDVTLTAISQAAFSVGAGPGGLPLVNVYDGGGNLIRSFYAYEQSFRGGVHVATFDVTGDGVPDTVTAPGFGGGPVVRVWDGVTGTLIRQFLAYDANFRGGVNLAVANIYDTVGLPQIVTGAGFGGGPHVRVFDAATTAVRNEFFAYDANFRGGVSVAATKSTGSSPGFIVTGPGPGGGPHVRLFDGPSGIAYLPGFLAYDPSFTGGVNVAATVILESQFTIRVVTAPASGGGPVVRVFDLSGLNLPLFMNQEFLAYEPSFRGGVNVALLPLDSGGRPAVLTGPGVGGGPLVSQFDLFGPERMRTRTFLAFDPAFLGGVFVG